MKELDEVLFTAGQFAQHPALVKALYTGNESKKPLPS